MGNNYWQPQATFWNQPTWDRPYYQGGAPTYGTSSTGTQTITPNVRFESRDPLKGSILEKGAIFGLDPLGIFDVPQLTLDIERLNPEELVRLTEQQAHRSWLASGALEEEFSPETAALRRESVAGLLGDVRSGGQVTEPWVMDQLMRLYQGYGQFSPMDMPEMGGSDLYDAARAQVMAELQLGGQLSPEIRNLVSREAAQRAGGSGFLGGQIGRDIGARDLGLTSMGLQQQRLQAALGLGQSEMGLAERQQGLKASLNAANRQLEQQQAGTQMNLASMFSGARQQELSNRLGLAQFGQGIERPMGSLDPGALASAYIADINQRNQLVNQGMVAQLGAESKAKESQLGLGGQVVGGILGMFCWVAREVYGGDNPDWQWFRLWLTGDAPGWLYDAYAKHGERFAGWLRGKRAAKAAVRWAMNFAVRKAKRAGSAGAVILSMAGGQ